MQLGIRLHDVNAAAPETLQTLEARAATAREEGFRRSLLVLAAYDQQELMGILRAVGDGSTVVFIQDLLVAPARQRQGVGTALVKALLARYPRVRQIQLTADDTPKTAAFYQSLGFAPLKKAGCIGYIKTGK